MSEPFFELESLNYWVLLQLQPKKHGQKTRWFTWYVLVMSIFVEEMNSCLWIAASKIHSGRQLQIVIHPLGEISCVGDVKRSKTSHVFNIFMRSPF